VVERADVPALDVRLLLRPGLEPRGPVSRFLERLVDEAARAGRRL
jgi:hypothetical protein